MTKCEIFRRTVKPFTGYTINDLKLRFGWRIKNAIYVDDVSGDEGLIAEVMHKKCQRWKFWNHDIRAAYRCYIGYLQVPWTIKLEQPAKVHYNPGLGDCSKYQKTVDPNLYSQIKR